MLNTMPFQHHITCIEYNDLHSLEKMFSKLCYKVPPSPLNELASVLIHILAVFL
jgi:hypothetical protein